jgi:hypothetical protein
MAVNHKQLNDNFGHGILTRSAITITEYLPEVLFIGTFNPMTDGNEDSDFFYSRNYFWPAIFTIFNLEPIGMTRRRDRSSPQTPNTGQILRACQTLKLSFTDLICRVLHANPPPYELDGNTVFMNNHPCNLIKDEELACLNLMGQIDWNTQQIINYISINPSIHSIYFTRKPEGIWKNPWQVITRHPCCAGKYIRNIYTPSGRRIKGDVLGGLIKHWVSDEGKKFGKLNPEWLRSHSVNINRFTL